MMVKKANQFYEKVFVQEVSFESLVGFANDEENEGDNGGDLMPRYNQEPEIEDNLFQDEILSMFEGRKREVVERVFNGDNFNKIGKAMGMKQSEIYGIKRELKKDLSFLLDSKARTKFVDENLAELSSIMDSPLFIKQLPLTDYLDMYIYDYDTEAEMKNWRAVAFQDKLESIWNSHPKSRVLAPREHLKTQTALGYIIKQVHQRDYPIEINYYHIVDSIAREKFGKLKLAIEKNPILCDVLKVDKAIAWADDYIELFDGTIIQCFGWNTKTVGKHPHIIVIDDVIDKQVMYSEEQNKKAITRFYADIYPQISKDFENKKIIIIGTAQRKDDLYHSLPADFHCETFKAVIDEEKQEILSPDLFSFEGLMKIKSDISDSQGEKFWLKEYQNTPFDAMGMIIKPDWIKRYSNLPKVFVDKNGKEQEVAYEHFAGWDLSVGKDIEKGDWTVGVNIAVARNTPKLKVYLTSFKRGRWDFQSRLNAVVNDFNDNQPLQVGIEEVAFQYDTVQTLKDKSLLPIKGVKAIKNKIESFQSELAPYFENGQVYIPEGEAWEMVVNELLSLPSGSFDDIADAIKIAIKIALKAAQPMVWSV